MPAPSRPAAVVRTLLLAVLSAVAAVQALWMLLLGLAMSYGTPLGAPDSDWRGAAGVAMGLAAVLFGAGAAALAVPRRELAIIGTIAGSALYTLVLVIYPGLDDAGAGLWASLAAPWIVAAAATALALRGRGTPKAPAQGVGAFGELEGDAAGGVPSQAVPS